MNGYTVQWEVLSKLDVCLGGTEYVLQWYIIVFVDP